MFSSLLIRSFFSLYTFYPLLLWPTYHNISCCLVSFEILENAQKQISYFHAGLHTHYCNGNLQLPVSGYCTFLQWKLECYIIKSYSLLTASFWKLQTKFCPSFKQFQYSMLSTSETQCLSSSWQQYWVIHLIIVWLQKVRYIGSAITHITAQLLKLLLLKFLTPCLCQLQPALNLRLKLVHLLKHPCPNTLHLLLLSSGHTQHSTTTHYGASHSCSCIMELCSKYVLLQTKLCQNPTHPLQ